MASVFLTKLFTESAISLTALSTTFISPSSTPRLRLPSLARARLSWDWCWTCSALWAIDEMLETSCSTAEAA
jgi:hypothetical protein